MISYEDALYKTSYFQSACKKAVALIRYCSITDVNKLLDSVTEARAEILANMSAKFADIKLTTDLMIKEQEEELIPALNELLGKIKANGGALKSGREALYPAKRAAEDSARQQYNIPDEMSVGDYSKMFESESDTPIFRDAKEIYDTVSIINESAENTDADISKINNMRQRFFSKGYNTLLLKMREVEVMKAKCKSLTLIIDSCGIVCKFFSEQTAVSNDIIASFTNRDIDEIVSDLANICIKERGADNG